VTDPYDRPMPVMWSCPNPDCPHTEIAPADVPESGEGTGAEAERSFTADEVAALLNVPSGTRKARGLRVIKRTRRAITGGAT
jgi:hypothetical protein